MYVFGQFAQRVFADLLIAVCLPILFREYKRSLVSPLQGLNQARIYLLSAAAFFAALDMFEVAVFAIATVGSKGRLLCGWAEKVTPSDHSVSVLQMPKVILGPLRPVDSLLLQLNSSSRLSTTSPTCTAPSGT